ncbi:hypothetical protein M514_14290 [Trichuris suis]|uniref:Uncharacterized protein n=1 Tax=Trichuris suis TaxID=68888 RepID=A0A085N0H0_9BILA|nr:hypothetical protein M513_14290 [Trichuris suis]KFD62966.1 hypothetical protein M514_14290 [Trichuris suis]
MSFKLRVPAVRKGLDVTGPQVGTVDTSNWQMRRTKENVTSPHYATRHLCHTGRSVDFTLPVEE